jgi:hypothetical protein
LYVETKIKHLDLLPIRHIRFTTENDDRRKHLDNLICQYESGQDNLLLNTIEWLLPKDASDNFLAFASGTTRCEERSDVVHDLLTHLARQMMEMNKQKQATVADFWLDLEGVTDAANFETLRTKGKREATLWKRAPACRPFVSQESHATRRLNESLGWNEDAFKAFVKVLVGKVQNLSDLVEVYRKYHPAYRDLVTRIQATDHLIDQIVYKLYGLTEEEIAIVEGDGE